MKKTTLKLNCSQEVRATKRKILENMVITNLYPFCFLNIAVKYQIRTPHPLNFYLYFFVFVAEDPYYCGLRARVPNFAKSNKKNNKDNVKRSGLSHPASMSSLHQLRQGACNQGNRVNSERNQSLWHARSFESGIGKRNKSLFCSIKLIFFFSNFSDLQESPYSHLYGQVAIPRGYVPTPRSMYIGEWD